MTAVIVEVKFGVGAKVFVADYKSECPHTPCPDCLGERAWRCALPSGESLSIPCPTCHYGYDGSRGWLAESLVFQPHVWQGTVGSVRVDTSSHDRPVTYMLEETGVGTGTVYDESRVFSDEIDALALATMEAVKRNIENERGLVLQRMRKRTDNPGSLVAYLRGQIRTFQKQIERTQAHLDGLPQAKP